MSGLNYFLRRMDSDVLNKKFINALNKCSERYNSIKKNYPQSLTWFKNFVTATLIMSVERMTKLEDESVIIRRGGEGDYYRKLEHKSNFENVQELFTWYEEFYLPEVYNVVMNTLLPIVYQDIDDKLDERMSY